MTAKARAASGRARAGASAGAGIGASRGPALPIVLLLVLLGASLAFYWPVLVGAPLGKAWFWEDFLEQNYPYRFYQASYLREGIFPLWNPFIFGGLPYAADVQAGAFYPPHWILPLFVSAGRLLPESYEGLEILHAAIGGFFMGLLARRLFGGRAAALFAGVGFAFSSFFVVRMKHGNIVETIAWIPGVLLFLREGLVTRRAAPIAIAALLFALLFTAGAPQYALYALFAAGLLVANDALGGRGDRAGRDEHGKGGGGGGRGGRRLATNALLLALLGVLVLLVTSAALLPSLELARATLRTQLSYDTASENSFLPRNLATFLLPRFFGTTAGGHTSAYFGGTYYAFWELACYFGVAALPLVALGLARPLGRDGRFLLVMGAFGLLVALGKYGPLHPLLFHLFPPYQRFRVPGRAILLTGMALLLLAARGVARLEAGVPDARGARRLVLRAAAAIGAAIAVATGVGLAAGPAHAAGARLRDAAVALALVGVAAAIVSRALRSPAEGRRGGLLLTALLLGDLAFFGFGYNLGPIDPAAAVFSKRSILDFIDTNLGGEPYRVKIRCPQGILLLRNAGSLTRIATVDGYNQLRLLRSHELMQAEERDPARFLSLWSVMYAAQAGAGPGSLTLARNPEALPRARLVHRSRVAGSDEEILATLADPAWRPDSAVVLEEGTSEEWSAPAGEPAPRFARFTPDEIALDVDARAPGFVVLTDPWYPGWQATIDGKAAPVLRADYALRAVRVDEGKHRVVFRFRPASVRIGVVASLVGLGAIAALVLRRGSGARALLKEILAP
jgi:hypothetical protein